MWNMVLRVEVFMAVTIKILFPVMWHYAVWGIVTDISEEYAGSIFRVEE